MKRIDEIIASLNLSPHPEGGYYRETYRSGGSISENNLPPDIKGERNYSTAIYFLLTSDNFSAFHKIKQDEIWHFYEGSPIEIHIISEKGNYSKAVLGLNLSEGEAPQIVIPANNWFAANVVKSNSYTLVGCTVAPGFDFNDFELGEKKKLISQFPRHEKIINKFTK